MCGRGKEEQTHTPTCTKHAPNVGVSLVKAMVYDVMDEGGAVEEHPLVGMVVVGLGHLLSAVHVALPHLGIHHTLNLYNTTKNT